MAACADEASPSSCFDRFSMRPGNIGSAPNLSMGEGALPPAVRQLLPLAFLVLSACADMSSQPSPPKECPKDLSAVTSQLVTPYAELDAYMGAGVLESTLHKPIDESIAHGGGIERSIKFVTEQVQELKNELANADQVRAQDKKAGMSDKSIDLYLSSVQDGITINQAFLDALNCRKAQHPEQSESVPAS
jgi:hypothetical protein